MTRAVSHVRAEPLEALVSKLFVAVGCPPEDSQRMAQALVQTNLWGVDSHGVLRVPDYIDRYRRGAMNARPDIAPLRQLRGVELIDADNGSGILAFSAAMKCAIDLAGSGNIAAVGVINSNHCGAAALYARMAAERNMVGIAMSNVAPNMVMPGGKEPITGNNPVAIAAPTFGEFPFVLDISLSAVAGGKLLAAARKGEPIPEGWAVDSHGRPTTDAQAGFDGHLLPVGGHKGYGLSLAVDILCGVITGGAFQHHLKSMYRYPDDPSATSHLALVIDPLAFTDRATLRERMQEFGETVRQSPMLDPDATAMLPGEPEYREERVRKSNGIPLPNTLFDKLNGLASELGVTARLEPL